MKKLINLIPIAIAILMLAACSAEVEETTTTDEKSVVEKVEVESEPIQTAPKEPHPYGGWFCPDNLGGFPPVDIQNLEEVPVVSGRLPTQEETRNGTSLMYIDTTEFPNAKPFEIDLPSVAKIHSNHNGLTELIIVIQAVIVGNDTVVGFRYPNGGNGSAWYSEVTILSEEEVKNIGTQPFVFLDTTIAATKQQIWTALTKTAYAQNLGKKFDQSEFFNSEWSDNSNVHLSYQLANENASGIVTNMYGNLYLHIDYELDGFHFSEKIFVMENPDGTSKIQLVAGPYPENFSANEMDWKNWFVQILE